MYSLSNIDITKAVNNFDYAQEMGLNIRNFSVNNDEFKKLYMLNYDKSKLDESLKLRNFRSVITDGEKIVCFSPPKSYNYDYTTDDVNTSFTVEEFIEGTMINVFNYEGTWMCATKSVIGARCKFFKDFAKTYRTLFLEVMNHIGLEFTDLDETCCYSFVMQHPENRIVVPFKEMSLVLIKKYKCNGFEVEEVNSFEEFDNVNIKRPTILSVYNSMNLHKIKDIFESDDNNYKMMGIVINNSTKRIKLWNPNYLKVKKLRGNNPKIQFQFYHLLKDKLIVEFLKYYPEYKRLFQDFKRDLFGYTENLWRKYRACYIYREKPLIEFGKQYRTHMFKIHQLYLCDLKPINKHTDKKFVIDYVNKLSPAELMYSINFVYREQKVDEATVVASKDIDLNLI
tara:strand:+ start:1949 stop:3139 length:1191 start_codon:yes stop_codon:yes gene_type:complete